MVLLAGLAIQSTYSMLVLRLFLESAVLAVTLKENAGYFYWQESPDPPSENLETVLVLCGSCDSEVLGYCQQLNCCASSQVDAVSGGLSNWTPLKHLNKKFCGFSILKE